MGEQLNSIPCKVNYNGVAKVSSYFNATKEIHDDDDGKNQTASFRGKRLTGTEIKLPDGYSAYVVDIGKTKNSADAEMKPEIIGNIKSICYWNYDCSPSPKDTIPKAVAWLKIAEKFANSDTS